MQDFQCKQLICESILVKHPEGPHQVEITAQLRGVGIWLTDKRGGPLVCICHGFDQGAQISVRSGRDTPGHDLSMNADRDSAQIQVYGQHTEQVIIVEATELYEMLAHLHRGRTIALGEK